jgi:hypothetical protein
MYEILNMPKRSNALAILRFLNGISYDMTGLSQLKEYY